MSVVTVSADDKQAPLVAPPPVLAVAPAQAQSIVSLDSEVIAKLDRQVDEFVASIQLCAPVDAEFRGLIRSIASLGEQDIATGAGISRRVLLRPAAATRDGGLAERSMVSTALRNLRTLVSQLDPAAAGDLLAPRKLLGLFPLGNRVDDYFERYRTAQSQLKACIDGLLRGKDELERDNAALDQEKAQMRGLLQRLEQYVYLLARLDTRIAAEALQLAEIEPDKARVLQDEVLFELRHKHSDLLTQTIVNAQGYLALEMIRKSNLELIKGVQSATTTTLAALRSAILVAQALNAQELVLDQIRGLNASAGQAIGAASAALRAAGGAAQQRSDDSAAQLDHLKLAFQRIRETMDSIATFKSAALGNLSQTVALLSAPAQPPTACMEPAPNDAESSGPRQSAARNNEIKLP